ncbi:MAG: hypothetical protein NC123_20255, partial [Butyrivibrio sp.]|nr:hypothetical protein [Butyrivibrio sp.]
MSINLIALLMLLAMQVMITMILNSLWRVLKKAGYLLKALILQIPVMQKVSLQMKEIEETASQKKTARKKTKKL